MDVEKTNSLKEIQIIDTKIKEIKTEKVYLLWQKQKMIFSQFQIVRLNYTELLRSLKTYKFLTKEFPLNNLTLIHRFQNIVSQKYFNFITTSHSFLERNKKMEFENELHCFFKEIRNFSAHHELLSIQTIWISNESGKARLESFKKKELYSFLKKRLEEMKKKKKPYSGIANALNFLKKLDKIPDFENLCTKYFEEILKINKEIFKSTITKNKNEFLSILDQTYILRNELKKLKTSVIGLAPPLNESESRFLKLYLNKYS